MTNTQTRTILTKTSLLPFHFVILYINPWRISCLSSATSSVNVSYSGNFSSRRRDQFGSVHFIMCSGWQGLCKAVPNNTTQNTWFGTVRSHCSAGSARRPLQNWDHTLFIRASKASQSLGWTGLSAQLPRTMSGLCCSSLFLFVGPLFFLAFVILT